MTEWTFGLQNVARNLPDEPASMRFLYALRRGSMKLGLYAPRGVDDQGPHNQDELYIVASGSGRVVKNGETRPFQVHDVIFVEAGAEHRFVDFSDDFSAWVVFWGPDGGEAKG
jgi:mannose-6-phosphate isomerase-like protein (cupin superfamily)